MKTCDICGVYLHAEHTLVVHIDGRVIHRVTVCLRHLDELREQLADALEPVVAVR